MATRAPDEWGGGQFYEIPETQDIKYVLEKRKPRPLDEVIELVRDVMNNDENKGTGFSIKKVGTDEWSRPFELKEALSRYKDKLQNASVGAAWSIRSEKSGLVLTTKKKDLNPAVVLDTPGTRAVDIIVGTVVKKFPDIKNLGICNCRYIAGTTTWSQHAWCNAVDFGGPTELLDKAAAYMKRLKDKGYIPLGTLLWRVEGHYNHIHAEGLPKQYGTPPCAQ